MYVSILERAGLRSDDGWTLPGRTARVRIFGAAGQTHPVIRTLTLGLQAPVDRRPFTVVSNRNRVRMTATVGDRVLAVVEACVPPGGFSDVLLRARGQSAVYGDPRERRDRRGKPRQAGLHLTEVAVADEIGPRRLPHAGDER